MKSIPSQNRSWRAQISASGSHHMTVHLSTSGSLRSSTRDSPWHTSSDFDDASFRASSITEALSSDISSPSRDDRWTLRFVSRVPDVIELTECDGSFAMCVVSQDMDVSRDGHISSFGILSRGEMLRAVNTSRLGLFGGRILVSRLGRACQMDISMLH